MLEILTNNLPALGAVAGVLFTIASTTKIIKEIFSGKEDEEDEEDKKDDVAALDDIIKNNDFFANMKKSVTFDIPNMFNIDKTKDAQFYLLIMIKFYVYNNNAKKLSRKVMTGEVKEITLANFSDFHFSSVEEYTRRFLDIGGSRILIKKFNDWNENRIQMIFEMSKSFITNNNFSTKYKLSSLLSIYNIVFFVTLDDLGIMYDRFNGELDKEAEKYSSSTAGMLDMFNKLFVFDDGGI